VNRRPKSTNWQIRAFSASPGKATKLFPVGEMGSYIIKNLRIFKKRIFLIIEKSKDGDLSSSVFDCFLIVLIVVNIIAVIVGSFSDVSAQFKHPLAIFEYFSIIIFTVEYLLRLWTANNKYPSSHFPYLKYIFSFMAIIDLCAILPFYLPFIVGIDFRFLRVLRLFRLLRVFKLNRYFASMSIIGQVLKNEKDKLISTIIITVLLLLLASSVMYYIENAVQPDKFPNIIATFWWAVATLTTVGVWRCISRNCFRKNF
jgi:voltage-gated potassium channel